MLNSNKYRIRDSFDNIETHEVFLDRLAHVKEQEFGISEKKFEVQISSRTIYIFFGLFVLLVFVLLARGAYFQTVKGQTYQALSQANKGGIDLVRPERGIIYDKNGVKLVLNAPAYDLLCYKKSLLKDVSEAQKQIAVVAQVAGQSVDEVKSKLTDSKDPRALIIQNIDQQKLLVLEARSNEIPDCQIQKNTVRNYVMGPVFSHVLGYNGKITKDELAGVTTAYESNDYIGKAGLEKQYESYLRGTPGRTINERSAIGELKGENVLSEPKSGYNLTLNIDSGLQKATYEALEKSIKNIGAKKGAAVALDPRNGAVLALVSYPSYDDNMFSRSVSQAAFNAVINDPNQPFFNRVVAAKYPVGSTIKPFEATAALQEKLIDPGKQINDPGYILVHSQNDPSVSYRFSGVTPHGWVDMKKAIAVSSNIYFFTIGGGYGDQQGLGPARIKKYLDMYGWEQKTGIDLPGEFKGFVPTPAWKKEVKNENWWDGDTYNLSIGQSDLQITPLQVAVAYSALANGGTLYQPQIVNKVTDNSSGTPQLVQEFKPQVTGKLAIDQQNLEIVRQGMRDAVEKDYGGSHYLANLPVAVAGKTGTAEIGRDGFYNTWSSSFAPYDNPEIVFVTTIEGVEGLRSATLPVAHDVLKYYFGDKTQEPETIDQ